MYIIHGILYFLGIGLTSIGIIRLFKVVFSRGIGATLLCIILPVLLLGFLQDEEGRNAWGNIGLGIILILISYIFGPVQ
jgi:hypothetical protein